MVDKHSKDSARQAREQAKLRAFLSQGGQNAVRLQARAELYSRAPGGKRERETAAGETTRVSSLLSPKLKLTRQQRAVGQCYGAYTEQITGAGGAVFLREFVDSGTSGGGGASERTMHMMAMVAVARESVGKMGVFRYPIGAARGEKRVGRHDPVPAIDLLDAVCIWGWSLSAVAISAGWLVDRNGRMVVADRQRKAVAAHLVAVLEAVADAWDDRGYQVPAIFGAVIPD